MTVQELMQELRKIEYTDRDMEIRIDDHGVNTITPTKISMFTYKYGPEVGMSFIKIE